MMIENLIQRHIDRIALLSQFLRTAHLGRRRQESAAARKVRRCLIVVLDDMLDYERDTLAVHRLYLAQTTEAERAQDEQAEPSWCEHEDMFGEDFSDVTLLDVAPLTGGGKAFDRSTGRWYVVEEGYPVRIQLTGAELGELSDLIAEMRLELGIDITAERVFWTEDALFVFAVAQEAHTTGAARPD